MTDSCISILNFLILTKEPCEHEHSSDLYKDQIKNVEPTSGSSHSPFCRSFTAPSAEVSDGVWNQNIKKNIKMYTSEVGLWATAQILDHLEWIDPEGRIDLTDWFESHIIRKNSGAKRARVVLFLPCGRRDAGWNENQAELSVQTDYGINGCWWFFWIRLSTEILILSKHYTPRQHV